MRFDTVIPTSKRIERLQYKNPWWTTGDVQQIYRDMCKRLYLNLFYPFVKEADIKRALVLMGPRRVGKTVLMHHNALDYYTGSINPHIYHTFIDIYLIVYL